MRQDIKMRKQIPEQLIQEMEELKDLGVSSTEISFLVEMKLNR